MVRRTSKIITPFILMTNPGNNRKNADGQTIIFFMMVLFILFFVVIWIFDLHKAIYVKSVSRNAGDSAALIAARWQGITLNLIGDLNIMHAMALSASNTEAEAAITNMQARLCYVGPMIAMMASQQAAKNNGIFPNPDFDTLLNEHAHQVRYDYPSQINPEDGTPLFSEPYPGCWPEYASMLELIAKDGVVAGPDNAHLYTDYTGGHVLLLIDFYEALAGRSWCWFYEHEPTLLKDYQNFFPCWWPALPEPPHEVYMNSEIFGLGLNKQITRLSDLTDENTVNAIATERQIPGELNTTGMTANAIWYAYGAPWKTWDIMTDSTFPITGTLKPQYNYAGADAVIRVDANIMRLTPSGKDKTKSHTVTWTAAAKPFGYLADNQRPNAFDVVLPAFRAVRLFPIDASSAPSGGAYNIAWRKHIEQHLPVYMENGPQPGSSCLYCQALMTWEDNDFRQSGIAWLSTNSWQCTFTSGPGGRGGGTRRGH
ncbi:MAG: hypothetical protein PHR77_18605 [Kiritimatiellae bacterium]|nr:hypothetical protein [Kiritimatiellia bacterium]MDD5520398.1 hypothetical protein [Kiritimatiellia bacterium]